MAQSLIFENPSKSVKATIPVNITWNPRTFGAGNLDNQGVFANFVSWTPKLDDVNVDVPQAGSDQLAWEKTNDNPKLSPFTTSFKGFSRGFTVERPDPDASQSSSLPLSSATSFPSSTISISTAAASLASSATSPANDSKAGLPVILGLSIGLGLLFLIGIGAAIWGVRRYRRLKNTSRAPQPQDELISTSQRNQPKGELEGTRVPEAVEMSSEIYGR
ncbi:hypothetical protein IFR05_006489 [Cadophora sp. M221]|nr:hypothetical protein IFR05_006489 [Cadophora sp. M221]